MPASRIRLAAASAAALLAACAVGPSTTSTDYEDLLQLWLSRTPVELIFDIEQAKEAAVETITF